MSVNGATIVAHGSPTTLSDGVNFFAAFARRQNSAAAAYTVQFSTDLATWTTSTDPPTVIASDSEVEIVTVPYPPGMIAFFRVIVTGQ